MASTVLTDVHFDSEVFQAQVAAAFTNKLELLASGAMANIPDSILGSNSKGYTAAFPTWNALSATATQITSSSSTTVNAVTDFQDIAAWVERETAWGADQAIKYIGGKDATQAVASMIGEYWANELHTTMINTLSGVFTTALLGTHVLDKTGVVISLSDGLAAKLKLGDYADMLSIVLMNSAVYGDAIREKLIIETPYADELSKTGKIETFLGSRVHVTDKLAATAGVYPTYFAAPGSMIWKMRNRTQNNLTNANIYTINSNGMIIEVELNRVPKSAGGQDEIITRASYLTHVPGVQFDGTVASNPTNAQLASGTTWTQVQTDAQLIQVVQMLNAVSA